MRLFIAVELSDEILSVLSQAQASLPREGLVFVKKENQHLTLKFLGEVGEDRLPTLKAALDGCRRAPFQVTVKGVGVFPSEKFVRVVWAGVHSTELAALAACIDNALAPLGFPREERPFSGHITLARVKAKTDVSRFLARFRDFDFGSCRIDRFVLKRSTLTPRGPIYDNMHVVVLESSPNRV
ncbi:MAG: RNA 2',3'-cyclic phosphodiesterase [Candidatus Micrarchaeia archaeon]